MENQCSESLSIDSKVSQKIRNYYFTQQKISPQSFFVINPRSYNYENPLIISQERLAGTLDEIKKKSPPLTPLVGEDLFYLYNESRRFEDQKCSFKILAEKKKFDIRPFLNLAHFCYKKYKSEYCEDSEYQSMNPEKESWVRENTVNLCKSFSKDVACEAEYSIHLRKNTLASMLKNYYSRFQADRFVALFKLRPNHSKFTCLAPNENAESKIVMKIKVFEGSFNHEILAELLKKVEETWSTKDFSLKLELIKTYSEGAITIVPTDKSISYVPDNNNRIVYLSTQQDLGTTKRVLAHEFGHVLGFPDCYIEFFDDSKKELVYYEISKNNTNIMCSLKDNVVVPDDYTTQLAEKSCLFY
jgi:hypothetical protein